MLIYNKVLVNYEPQYTDFSVEKKKRVKHRFKDLFVSGFEYMVILIFKNLNFKQTISQTSSIISIIKAGNNSCKLKNEIRQI